MDYETIAVVGVMLSPLYAILLWRMKKSDAIEKKVTKICTALKMKFPEMIDVLK